jgi:KilA-N domain
MKNTEYEYQDAKISFAHKDDKVMINATEMAKSFGKQPANWLRLKSTKKFLKALTDNRYTEMQNGKNKLIQLVQGGNEKTSQGTWLHQDAALEFARWLNPRFGIWCNDRIKELLSTGLTAAPDVMEAILEDPDLGIQLFTQLKEYRERVKQMEPKVSFYDTDTDSENTFNGGETAIMLKL